MNEQPGTARPARASRCAVYTRKSSEEGLDMAFNSLDAQREAGRDFIKSQRGQGWTAVSTHYDDGGYSGGTTERPGLQKLLADIKAGRIDVVVVYKVDRLSRSLADFARLMQFFDEHGVSFVSVTQQFNTTTSMGRLTLNMLLSFAQFEREVAGERIRDKIAATKRKGVWVCGQPPLGYRLLREGDPDFKPGDRTLRIVEPEAALIRAIFKGYLELGSPIKLAERLNRQGHRTRRWTSSTGKAHGGNPMTPQYLYGVLTNPVYIGRITHKRRRQCAPSGERRSNPASRRREHAEQPGDVWPGLHKPIIDQVTWDRVQALMGGIQRAQRQQWTHTHLLKGKLRTFEGAVMSPSSVQRPSTKRQDQTASDQKRIIYYYVSQKAIKQGYKHCPIKTVNAGHLDDVVRGLVLDHLHGTLEVDIRAFEPSVRDRHIRDIITDVVLAPDSLTLALDRQKLADMPAIITKRVGSKGDAPRNAPAPTAIPTCAFKPKVDDHDGVIRMTVRLQIKRLDGRRFLLGPDGQDLLTTITAEGRPIPREHIVHAIGLAYAWRDELLRTGGRIVDLAHQYGLADGRVHRLLTLTQLKPELLRRALKGELPATVTLDGLIATSANLDWELQAVDYSPA
ncbi:MAG: recombinase family protein [Phycisphaerales bacterium]|nr:recombinase family protein [Phycisphaerales bacterium]